MVIVDELSAQIPKLHRLVSELYYKLNFHGFVHYKNIPIYIQQDATLHTLLYLETALHVWVVKPLIIRSVNNCIYSIWYLSHRYCYLPL